MKGQVGDGVRRCDSAAMAAGHVCGSVTMSATDLSHLHSTLTSYGSDGIKIKSKVQTETGL